MSLWINQLLSGKPSAAIDFFAKI